MSPIYGAYLQYEEDFTELQLLAESIPFIKSILGYDTAIDIIAEKGLPRHIMRSGNPARIKHLNVFKQSVGYYHIDFDDFFIIYFNSYIQT